MEKASTCPSVNLNQEFSVEDVNRHFSRGEKLIANNYLKTWPKSLVIRKMLVKISMRYLLICTGCKQK
jgi:hypothetical protein